MRTILIAGQTYLWRDILKMRRDQRKAQKKPQLTLFEMKEDSRPATQLSASGRFQEPTLFENVARSS
jgi:hypothetical protein